jgi:hypothetical protein
MQLDADSRAELEAYKASVTPASATRDANWEAIARRALRGDGPAWIDEASLVPRRRRTRTWIAAAGITVAAAAAAVMLVAGPDLLVRGDGAAVPSTASYEAADGERAASDAATRQQAERGVPAVRVDPQPTLIAEEEVASAVESPEVEVREKPQPAARRGRKAPPERAPEGRDVDPLEVVRAESLLIGRARAALRDDDPAAASRLLDQHARRFPSGELEQERELLRVIALCDSGQTDAARRSARGFREAFSGSPLLGHLESTCAGSQ